MGAMPTPMEGRSDDGGLQTTYCAREDNMLTEDHPPAEVEPVIDDTPLSIVLDRLDDVEEGPNGRTASCPVRNNPNHRLTVTENEHGNVSLRCSSNWCALKEILDALDLEVADLFPHKNGQHQFCDGDEPRDLGPITVASLAAYTKLPEEFLRDMGLHDLPNGGVGIPYRDASGQIVATMRRTALDPHGSSFWLVDVPLIPYGLERLKEVHDVTDDLIFVSDELECLTLWHHGWHALGIPGPNAAKALQAEHVELSDYLSVVKEPGQAGEDFVASIVERVRELDCKDRICFITLEVAKNVNELHRLFHHDPIGFGSVLGLWLNEYADCLNLRQSPSNSTAGIVRLADVKTEKTKWLWKDRMPLGKISVLEGDPDLGKSVLTEDLAARVTTASAMPGETDCPLPGPAGVVILSAEDGLADTIRPRLEAAGANMSRVVCLTHILDPKGERPPTIADIVEIEEAIQRVEAKLLIIDPLMAFIPGSTNSRDDQTMRRLLAPLAALAERTGVAVVLLRHLTKARGKNPLYQGGGSIGIIGAARSALMVAMDPADPSGDRRIIASIKSNLSAAPPAIAYHLEEASNGSVQVVWDGETDATTDSLLAAGTGGEGRSALDEAGGFLLDTLAGGPQSVKDIIKEARSAGIAERTLKRAKAALGVGSVKVNVPGGNAYWAWQLSSKGAMGANGAKQ